MADRAKAKNHRGPVSRAAQHAVKRPQDSWQGMSLLRYSGFYPTCYTRVNFTKTLKFRNGGLAHARYAEVVGQLNCSTTINSPCCGLVLDSAWGSSMTHSSYECKSKGTCSPSSQDICTSNCFRIVPRWRAKMGNCSGPEVLLWEISRWQFTETPPDRRTSRDVWFAAPSPSVHES